MYTPDGGLGGLCYLYHVHVWTAITNYWSILHVGGFMVGDNSIDACLNSLDAVRIHWKYKQLNELFY